MAKRRRLAAAGCQLSCHAWLQAEGTAAVGVPALLRSLLLRLAAGWQSRAAGVLLAHLHCKQMSARLA